MEFQQQKMTKITTCLRRYIWNFFPLDWGMLRRSMPVLIFLSTDMYQVHDIIYYYTAVVVESYYSTNLRSTPILPLCLAPTNIVTYYNILYKIQTNIGKERVVRDPPFKTEV